MWPQSFSLWYVHTNPSFSVRMINGSGREQTCEVIRKCRSWCVHLVCKSDASSCNCAIYSTEKNLLATAMPDGFFPREIQCLEKSHDRYGWSTKITSLPSMFFHHVFSTSTWWYCHKKLCTRWSQQTLNVCHSQMILATFPTISPIIIGCCLGCGSSASLPRLFSLPITSMQLTMNTVIQYLINSLGISIQILVFPFIYPHYAQLLTLQS